MQIQTSFTGDRERRNLIENGDFALGSPGSLPEGWEAVCPNAALAPNFEWARNADGTTSLHARGNGRGECFGYVRHPVNLEAGQTYRLCVRLRFEE